jgi:hypothetical protein
MRLLKDRTFLALVSILVIIIILMALGLYTSSNNLTTGSANGFTIGDNLSEQQKSLVLDIAMNDSILNDELIGADGLLTSGNISDASKNYHVEDISVARYDDPNLHISGAWPAVTFIVGNISQEGPTLQAFVDPANKRVVYISEDWRPVNGNPDNIHLLNVSIADTGYKYNTNLTDEQQSLAFQMALANESVAGYLKGNNYTLNGVGMAMFENRNGLSTIKHVYPSVTFYIKPYTMIGAYIDINNNKVIGVSSYPVTPLWITPELNNYNSSSTSNPQS